MNNDDSKTRNIRILLSAALDSLLLQLRNGGGDNNIENDNNQNNNHNNHDCGTGFLANVIGMNESFKNCI